MLLPRDHIGPTRPFNSQLSKALWRLEQEEIACANRKLGRAPKKTAKGKGRKVRKRKGPGSRRGLR